MGRSKKDMKKSLMFLSGTFMAFMVFTAFSPRPQGAEIPVRIETALGVIDIVVDTAHAPITSANFLKYVDAKLYDGGRFYRVTRPDNYTPAPPNRPMMEIIQGGIDPAKRAQVGNPIPLERTSVTGLKHVAGTVLDGAQRRRLGDDGVFHPAGRSTFARLWRQAIRRRARRRRVRPRDVWPRRGPQDSATEPDSR
jgi:hypothetical protein